MADSMGDLVPVDWYDYEGPTDNPYPFYRACDFCHRTATDDLLNGKDIEGFRKFYRSHREGLNVCEHCVSRYLNEKQQPSFYEWLNATQRDELATAQGGNP